MYLRGMLDLLPRHGLPQSSKNPVQFSAIQHVVFAFGNMPLEMTCLQFSQVVARQHAQLRTTFGCFCFLRYPPVFKCLATHILTLIFDVLRHQDAAADYGLEMETAQNFHEFFAHE